MFFDESFATRFFFGIMRLSSRRSDVYRLGPLVPESFEHRFVSSRLKRADTVWAVAGRVRTPDLVMHASDPPIRIEAV